MVEEVPQKFSLHPNQKKSKIQIRKKVLRHIVIEKVKVIIT